MKLLGFLYNGLCVKNKLVNEFYRYCLFRPISYVAEHFFHHPLSTREEELYCENLEDADGSRIFNFWMIFFFIIWFLENIILFFSPIKWVNFLFILIPGCIAGLLSFLLNKFIIEKNKRQLIQKVQAYQQKGKWFHIGSFICFLFVLFLSLSLFLFSVYMLLKHNYPNSFFII